MMRLSSIVVRQSVRPSVTDVLWLNCQRKLITLCSKLKHAKFQRFSARETFSNSGLN